MDRFSIGGSVVTSLSTDYKNYGVGPSLSYYFFQKDKWASFFALGAFYQESHYSSYYDNTTYQNFSGQAKLGLNYFIYPSVAIGPLLSFDHSFSHPSDSYYNSNSARLFLLFSVFL